MLEILFLPFMQRALLSGVIISVLLGWMGVFVISRQMSFIGAGVAHASLAAIAFAVLFGLAPLPVALVFGVLVGAGLYYLDVKTTISRDTAIGILFSAGMALGVLLLQFHQGYAPDLISFLFGNILSVRALDLGLVAFFGFLVLLCLWRYYRHFTFVTVDPEGAQISGVQRQRMELLLYILISLVVVLAIKLVGIVLVSALLVIPSAIGKTLARSFAQFQWFSVLASIIIILCGLLFSLYADLPSGASIVLVGVVLFILVRMFALVRS